MMSNGTNERLKIYTQHVPLRKNVEEKVRGKEIETVCEEGEVWSTYLDREPIDLGTKLSVHQEVKTPLIPRIVRPQPLYRTSA